MELTYHNFSCPDANTALGVRAARVQEFKSSPAAVHIKMSTRWWLPELPSLGARSPSSAVRQAAEAPTGDSVPVLHCWPVTVPTEGSSGHQLRANFPDGSHVILKVPEGVQAGETLQCAV